MTVSLAWHNLRNERIRTLTATAGVTFAVVLMLMQLGFYLSASRTATLIYDQLVFDILLYSPDYKNLAWSGRFPQKRLQQALSLPEVQAAEPLYLGSDLWTRTELEPPPHLNPPPDKYRRNIMILACRPQGHVFYLREILQQQQQLVHENTVLMDRKSREQFGPNRVGLETEVGHHRVEIVGNYSLGAGFGADGAILTSDLTFAKITGAALDRVHLGLIQLQPDADAEQVVARLKQFLPDDVCVRTRAEALEAETTFWVEKTAVGTIFFWGAGIAFLVGMSIVYQVLSSDIAYRVSEYATLKAIGYHARYLFGIVLQQAMILSVGGFVCGYLISQGLFALVRQLANIPMILDLYLAGFVFLLSSLMCMLSGFIALRKLQAANPADLF